MRFLLVLSLLALTACVPATSIPAPQVQYGNGSGAVLADAVRITGIRGEIGAANTEANAAIATAEANWLSVEYPGWTIGGKQGGVDGTMVYHAVTIRNGAASKTVYFDVSEFAWSVMPA